MVFSKGDLRKKNVVPCIWGEERKEERKKGKFWVLDPSKGLVLFWETVDGGVEHF